MKGQGEFLSAETIAFRLERELYEYRNGDIDEVVIESTEEVKKVFCGEQNIHKNRLGRNSWLFRLNFDIQTNMTKPFYQYSYMH